MKSIAFGLLLLSGLCCYANDINIVAASDWSKPVSLRRVDTGHDHSIRGRVLIIAGNEPAYGGPQTDNNTMTFVELQNVTEAQSENVDLHIGEMKFILTNQNGKDAPEPGVTAGSYLSAIGSGPCWESLPYNSTIRLFVISGTKSPLTITKNGDPFSHWSIPAIDTNEYFLTGTLQIFTRTNGLDSCFPKELEELKQTYYNQNCKATITFPKTKFPAKK
ncbi:MAG: hypothetical protein WCS42_09870 [Verrucomicrobiota bacterium]